MRAARPPAGRERGSAAGSGRRLDPPARRGGQGRAGLGRGALCRSPPLGSAPAAGSAQEGTEARPRRRPGARLAEGGPRGSVGCPRDAPSVPLRYGPASPRCPAGPVGLRLGPFESAWTRLSAARRGSGGGSVSARCSHGPGPPGGCPSRGESAGRGGAGAGRGAWWLFPFSPVGPVTSLPAGFSEVGKDRSGLPEPCL